MSDAIDAAVKSLNERLEGADLDGSVKFVIEDEGSLRIENGEATADDGDADCTMTASSETFQDILSGTLDPTAAFMSGRLKIDGDMGLAMQLGNMLG